MGWWILLRLLFAALIIRLIWKLVAGAVSGAAGPRPRGAKRGVALVRDPVCGTYVEPSPRHQDPCGRDDTTISVRRNAGGRS